MSSIYGKKVVAVLDTQSNFGIQFQSVVDNVSTLSTQMSTLLADSPDSLNTLNEIADALGDDPAFFSTMATANTTLQSNIDALSAAAATARATLQTALSGRLDTLEADATTATALSSLETSLTAVDATLSGRLDVLESDPTTKTYVDAQVSSLIDGAPDLLNTLDELASAINDDENVYTSLTSADTALSARITTLEADPTTATALAAVQADVDQNESDSDAADTALSGRLDVLESDPTTATAVATVQAELDAEESSRATADAALGTRITALEADPTTATAVAAVQADVDQNESDADAAIALKLDIANPAATGDLTVDTQTRLEFDGNITKLHNDLRGTRLDIGNNITVYPASAGGRFEIEGGLYIRLSDLVEANNDNDAETAGVIVGGVYYDGNGHLKIRVS